MNGYIFVKSLRVGVSLPAFLTRRKILNECEVIIYVGKAKNLKKRVRSYFNNSQKSTKTIAQVQHDVRISQG